MHTARFNQQQVVVTGGISGIGAAIACRLASEGAQVTILDVNAAAADQLARKICGTAALCDVADLAAVEGAFAAMARVDVLVNCAGIAHVGNVETTMPADMDHLYAVNVKGTYHTMHVAVPRMVAQGKGVILNMASIASKVGIEDRFAYGMTKGAVLTMTLSVARDYVHKGIRCNCICPARVHTPFVDGFLAEHYPDREQEVFGQLSSYQPIGRMGMPEEVAALAAFLCSDEAAFVTGSAYDMDGGVTLLR